MYASDGDFDNADLSFATMLDTSARIAVVAARDVRRKDRRVCMSRSGLDPAQIIWRLKHKWRAVGRAALSALGGRRTRGALSRPSALFGNRCRRLTFRRRGRRRYVLFDQVPEHCREQ